MVPGGGHVGRTVGRPGVSSASIGLVSAGDSFRATLVASGVSRRGARQLFPTPSPTSSLHACRRLSRHLPGKGRPGCGGLHHQAAAAALLRRVGVLSPGDGAPDRRHHVVLRAVAVRDDAIDALVANSLRRHDAQLQRRGPINRTFSPRCSRGSAPCPGPPEAGCSALLGAAA